MKKVIAVFAILLAIGTVALFVLHLRQNDAAESRPTGTTQETVPDGTTAPEAPEYTFPKNEPLPTGTQPESTDGGSATVPTAAPGLDEDETPHMDV